MKSGGSWNLRGLRPQARAAAREAARRSGMSIGEWLDAVIGPLDDEDDDSAGAAALPRDHKDQRRRDARNDDQQRRPWHRNNAKRGRGRAKDEWAMRHWGAPDRDEHHLGASDRREHEGPRPDRPHRPIRPPAPEPRDTRVAQPPQERRHDPVEQAVAQITARQRALEGSGESEAWRAAPASAAALSFGRRQPQPFSSVGEQLRPSRNDDLMSAEGSPELDLSNLERQLRRMTAGIEALRPSKQLEAAINGLHAELADVGRSITRAASRDAVESLALEVKALAQRIDHGHQPAVDQTALAGVESGLAAIREALGTLTGEPAAGSEGAIAELARKIDLLVAQKDPAALQRLEEAIGTLRTIIAHGAPDGTLTRVAEDVRALTTKVDNLANGESSVSALGRRIDTLAAALEASTEAGHAVPRELGKLLSGLIEKLERVQPTHAEYPALNQLEDRIAALVKRLDSSSARVGFLEDVERKLDDFLRRASGADSAGVAIGAAAAAQETDWTGPTEQRASSSESVSHGARHHVAGAALAARAVDAAQKLTAVPLASVELVPDTMNATRPAGPAQAAKSAETGAAAGPRAPGARAPIDPDLPPDHPLEPGFKAGRFHQAPSAADRIAASEAVITKPPVIPDPGGGKPDFIAAARRAARAAAVTPANEKSGDAGGSRSERSTKIAARLRTVMVAAAVFAIVVGGFRIVSRLFEGGAKLPSSPQTRSLQTAPPASPEPPQALREPSRLQSESPSGEPPGEKAPAAVAPEPSRISLPMAIAPGTGPAPKPAAAPSASAPGKETIPDGGGKPLGDTKDSSAGAGRSLTPPASEPSPRQTPDTTGSLPSLMPSPAVAMSSVSAVGEALPEAIGDAALRAAALAGDPAAAYEVGVRFAEGRLVPTNNEAAAHWFERAAAKGLAPAEFRLGALYEKGLGVRKNLAAARDLYRAAAAKGHAKAMHNLAVLYAEGVDGKVDYRTAAQWFRKAAEHGVTDSQYNLAVLYARGAGVEQNFAESYKWFFLAAKAGDKDAARKRDEVAARLDPEALAAARATAERWMPLPQAAGTVTLKTPQAWEASEKVAPAGKSKSQPRAETSGPGARAD
jgi:localization factor PodJL